ncbi:MAG: MoaD/ThiS family protein [Desulfosudaceae bacterium]
MHIDVYLYASLAKYLPQPNREKHTRLSLPEGATVRDILRRLEVPEKKVKLVFVNGVRREASAPLADGDRVGFFPPVGGG